MMDNHHGMRIFVTIWLGQALSLIGTAMTRFALLIWAYDQTGQATTLALLGFFSYVVVIVLKPVAGVWADRWDRRWVMIGGDLGAGLVTVGLLVLYMTGDLAIWHLYAGQMVTGAFEAFQVPAYNAAIGVLVPRQQLTRASGLRTLGDDTARILAPVLGGLVLSVSNLGVVMLIDVITVSAAVGALLIVRIPRAMLSSEGAQIEKASFRAQMAFGWRYIVARRGLLQLLIVYSLINLLAAFTYFGVLPAMILARSGGDELALSSVQAALGVGGIIGGVIVTTTGGPRRKIHGVLGITAMSFLFGDMMLAFGRTPLAWTAAGLVSAVCVPFVISGDRAIWQSKVPPDIQGRVLGTAFSLREIPFPVGYLLTGPLADRVFEPLMQPGGGLSGVFGGLVGTGPGAGMAVMFLIAGFTGASVCLGGYLFPALRNVESDLPDYDALPGVPAAAVALAAGD